MKWVQSILSTKLCNNGFSGSLFWYNFHYDLQEYEHLCPLFSNSLLVPKLANIELFSSPWGLHWVALSLHWLLGIESRRYLHQKGGINPTLKVSFPAMFGITVWTVRVSLSLIDGNLRSKQLIVFHHFWTTCRVLDADQTNNIEPKSNC